MSKKITLCLLFILLFVTGCNTDNKFSDGYAIVYKENTPYLLNKANQLYDLSDYDQVGDTFGEYIVVMKYKGEVLKYGYINNDGKEVIKPQYDIAYPFSEGLAVVVKDGKYMIINEENKVQYEFEDGYQAYSSFKDGFLKIEKNGKFSFLSKDFKICPKEFDGLEDFNEGYALVTNFVDGVKTYNFIDTNYTLLFTNQLEGYEFADSFYSGYARIGQTIDDTFYYSYINSAGELLKDENNDTKFLYALNFSDDTAIVFSGKPYMEYPSFALYSYMFMDLEGQYYDYTTFYEEFDGSSHAAFQRSINIKDYKNGTLILHKIDTGAGSWRIYGVSNNDLTRVDLSFDYELTPTEQQYYKSPYSMEYFKTTSFYNNEPSTFIIVRIYNDCYGIVDTAGNYITPAIYDRIVL